MAGHWDKNLPTTHHEFVFRKHSNPKFENGVKIIGTVDPGFGGLLGVAPLSSSTALVYSCTKIHLVDIERGEIVKRCSSPISIINLHALDETKLIVVDLIEKDLWRMCIEDESNIQIGPFEIKINESKDETAEKNNENVTNPQSNEKDGERNDSDDYDDDYDDSDGDRIQAFGFSVSGDIISCLFRIENIDDVTTEVPYMQRFNSNGVLVKEKALEHEGNNLFIYSASAIVVNGNGDICLAVYDTDTCEISHLYVLTEDFDLKFSYRKDDSIHDLATDSKSNILVCCFGYIDVLDPEGNFIFSFKTDFGEDGKGNTVSVDKEGKAWIGTETGRVVLIDYGNTCPS